MKQFRSSNFLLLGLLISLAATRGAYACPTCATASPPPPEYSTLCIHNSTKTIVDYEYSWGNVNGVISLHPGEYKDHYHPYTENQIATENFYSPDFTFWLRSHRGFLEPLGLQIDANNAQILADMPTIQMSCEEGANYGIFAERDYSDTVVVERVVY